VPSRQLVRHLPVDRPTHSEFRADDGRRSDIEDSWDLDQGNVEFSPDGRWLGIGGAEYHLWETATWTEVRRLPHPERNASTAMLAFSPGNTLWALAWESRDLRLVDPATGRVLATLEAPNRPVLNGFRFTPDGLRLVAVQQDRQLQFWDLRRLRMELAKIGLDWDMPAYPPEMPPRGNRGAPVTLRIEPGAAGKR